MITSDTHPWMTEKYLAEQRRIESLKAVQGVISTHPFDSRTAPRRISAAMLPERSG
jgi:hypothetical protein